MEPFEMKLGHLDIHIDVKVKPEDTCHDLNYNVLLPLDYDHVDNLIFAMKQRKPPARFGVYLNRTNEIDPLRVWLEVYIKILRHHAIFSNADMQIIISLDSEENFEYTKTQLWNERHQVYWCRGAIEASTFIHFDHINETIASETWSRILSVLGMPIQRTQYIHQLSFSTFLRHVKIYSCWSRLIQKSAEKYFKTEEAWENYQKGMIFPINDSYDQKIWSYELFKAAIKAYIRK